MQSFRRAMTVLLVAAPAFIGAARAQTAPALVYSHPLSPSAVAAVQQRLQQAGVYGGRADGVWGPESQAALERFQQTRSLQVTGQLNQATAATLGLQPADVLAAGPAPAAVAPAAAGAADPLSPGVIRNVQLRLRSLGFYRGGADGVWGAGTQAALERFQQGRGLQANGQVNPATIQALGLDPNNPAARLR